MLTHDQKIEFKQKIHEHIDKHCIFRCNPSIQYTPGIKKGHIPSKGVIDNKYQFFLRNLTHNPVISYYTSMLILDDIARTMNENNEDPYFQLCGLETSSTPFIISLQMTALKFGISINSFSIRKERKSYGLFQYVDGKPTDAPVIIIDDLINSGNSIIKCIDVCKYEYNLSINPNVYSIITLSKEPYYFDYDNKRMIINSIFVKEDFNYEYDVDKYWLPKDCDKSINKRPEYF